MRKGSEAKIQTQIIEWAKTQKDIWICKYPAGTYGMTGVPDLILAVGNRFLALEVKTPEGQLTKMQERTMMLLISIGANCEVVRCLADAIKAVERLRNEE